MTRPAIKRFFSLVFTFFLLNPLFSQSKSLFETYVNFELPAGTNTVHKDNISATYTHQLYPVTTEIKLLPSSDYSNPSDALTSTLNKIKASHSVDSFVWNNRDCAISHMTFKMNIDYEGYAVTFKTDDGKYFVFVISYVGSYVSRTFLPFTVSSINSIWITPEDYLSEGIIMTYAYPKEGKIDLDFEFDNKKIHSSLDKTDTEAGQYLIDMEYKVFLYCSGDKYRTQARHRFYHQIYRDNYPRIKNVLYDICKIYNPKMKKWEPKEALTFARAVLRWLQDSPYVRAATTNDSDVTCFPAIFQGAGTDCDSRSLILNAFMQFIGVDSLLFVSDEFAHALAGINIDAPGQAFLVNNKKYLLGETTAHVSWGTIALEHADPSKWECISLY